MVHRYEIMIGGRMLSIESGKLAGQANGAVQVRYGDTIVLATATAARQPRSDVDFFPLTVDYEERMYAAGKIPGGFFKREGRPSEQAILTCRLTDRPIRPLFPKGFRNDVQVIIATLSTDQENEPDLLSIIGASAALTISDIPFEGPVGAVRVGYLNGQLILNPTASQLEQSDLELTIAGTEDAIVMVEAGANEVPESVVVDALRFGQTALQDIVKLQKRMQEAIGKPKFSYTPVLLDPDLVEAVRAAADDRIQTLVYQADKAGRDDLRHQLEADLAARFGEQYRPKDLAAAVETIEAEIVRRGILDEGRRPDGRDATTVRPISCEVGLLPRTHGSGLFTRGQTQVLSIVTLGSMGEEQVIDGLGLDETKRFIHHYNFPPFSVGEVRRLGSPGRREIGHGALAERSVAAVIPPVSDFPYTIRIVSEVLSSNGSTSMGSVCGSVLALMDAGVPIKAPVAGVAMGLITDENGRYAVLTDIQGVEDHLGDMDFKVAGSAKGITALQMDIKVKGLTYEVMEKALAQALVGRLFILDRMLGTIQHTRPELSQYAPRVYKCKIPVDRIGQLIGPGGKTIRGLQEEHGVKIDVEEDGTVYISGADPEGAKRAVAVVERMGRDIEVGADYLGKVTRITNFGCFVEILPGKDGLVRTSELAEGNITRPEDVVSVGDEIMVRVIEVDFQGRVNLSRRAVLEGTPGKAGGARPPSGPTSGGGGGSGGYRGGPGGSGGYRGGPPGPPRTGGPGGQSRPPYGGAPRSSSAPQRGPYDRGPMDRERERERERRLGGNPPGRDNPRPGPAPETNRW